MKKFINRPENAVEEMLRGLTALHPGLIRLPGQKVLVRADAEKVRNRQIAIISGGGSGHEPAHAGYVGAGMLSAAVAGEIFTSPDPNSIFAAIKAVAGNPGALLVVKNYTGDRLNFGLAAEMARSEGIPIETIVVNDDVALNETGSSADARGIAGTVLVHKIAGAAAAEGKTLSEVAAIGKAAITSIATMGVSFSAGTSPLVGKPSFELGDDEIELGLGIHGEPGVTRTSLQHADQLTETLLKTILKDGRFGATKRVAVLINNLGATTEMEVAIIARHTIRFLEHESFIVDRIYAGTFLSSLDMAGISISVLGINDDRLRWLDAPTTAPAWPNVLKQPPGKLDPELIVTASPGPNATTAREVQTEAGRETRRAIEAACQAIIDAEGELQELDRITGDGDLGASMKRAALAVQDSLLFYPLDDLSATFKALGHTLRRELGGSSGPLYGAFFLRCSSALGNSGRPSLAHWADALKEGCDAISELGDAQPGDRTMLDAIYPFVMSLESAGPDVKRELLAATGEAQKGVQSTAQMLPRRGRSRYLRERVLGHPDPGAKAVAILLSAITGALFPN